MKNNYNPDWGKIDALLKANCSGIEIANYLGIHKDTIYRACVREKGMKWEDYSRSKKAVGKAMIRVKKFDLCMDGDKTMLIWESKQRLGETDKSYTETHAQITQVIPDNISECDAQSAAMIYEQLLNFKQKEEDDNDGGEKSADEE